MKTTKVKLSRPKDQSLEAFKEWMTGVMVGLLGEGGGSDITEEKWESAWVKFWKNKDAKNAEDAKEAK